MPFLTLAQSSETVSTIQWESAPEAWQTFLLVALVAAFAAACYLLEGKEDRRWLKVPLALVRALLIILAIIAVAAMLRYKRTLD